MRRHLPLSALRAFEAAARHGSFKHAARELAVTPTAVSHQIRTLEALLGVSLFERQARKVALTEVGAELHPVLRAGFDAFEAALERLVHARRRPRVTISATSAFTTKWLVPRLAGFQRLHPDIDLQLHASNEPVDLAASEVDIAIRYGRGPYPGLAAEPMFTDWFAPVANPALGIASPADLDEAPLIHFEWRRPSALDPTWQAWFAQAGRSATESAAQLRFSDEGHAIQAAVAGQGIALLSLALVRDDLSAGHLVQPFGPSIAGHTYHLVTPEGGARDPAAAAAAAWLRARANETDRGV